jgi:hypothetical protein
MKSIVFIVLVAGMFSCVGNKQKNQTEPESKTAVSGQMPKIDFEEEMHDFGLVKAGEILTYSFQFTNRGETDLKINNAETDCGCIEATIAKSTIPAGEKGFIEVKFNSAGLFGKQLKTVEIQSNSKEPKHLIIFAEVENEQIEIKNLKR